MPRALRPVEDGGQDHFLRNDLVLENLLVVIDVVDEFVQGVNALLESALDPLPFVAAYDSAESGRMERFVPYRRNPHRR